MVLRSGIILPFQFRDIKKLLMIGTLEENRDLSIWDLKNVVRAAFGIYNFEFRNKKIGFNIPDELLLHYLAQRHDLTNFVIEIGQGLEDNNSREAISPEAASLQKTNMSLPQRSNDSSSINDNQLPPYLSTMQRDKTLTELTNNTTEDELGNTQDEAPPHKIRISQVYTEQTSEALTQAIDPMDIIPKSEHDEAEMDLHAQTMHQQTTQQQQEQQKASPHLYANYAHAMLGQQTPHIMQQQQQQQQQQHQYSPAMMNRFRRRGERMSKDQKEMYVKYFEDNPCMLTQRRNDIVLEPHWHKLASMLNSVAQGAVKNVEEWKQTFDAWRYRVFMYTRYNSKLTGAAAQNPKNYKPLTTTDQRAYAMWTSHKNTAPQDYEKMDMFANLDETQTDYDY